MFQQKLHLIILYHLVKREENLFTQQELGPSLISVPKSNIRRVFKTKLLLVVSYNLGYDYSATGKEGLRQNQFRII